MAAFFLVPFNITLFLTLRLTGSDALGATRIYKSLWFVRDGLECIFNSFFYSLMELKIT